jgi:hypothetical protein
MSFSIFKYFNYSKNPTLTMPLCPVPYSNMFPRSYSSSNSGPKLPLAGTWPKSPKSSVNLIGATKSLELQNPKSSFAIFEVLPKIPYVIDVDFNEIILEIVNFTTIDLGEIVELLDFRFDPQVDPLRKKQKLGVDGIGKKPYKKSYDSNRKFQEKWSTKLPWVEGLMVVGGII